MTIAEILAEISRRKPDIVMLGHSGSSSAHVTVIAICTQLKSMLPGVLIIYGRVYPTYHRQEILNQHACIDYIVRGEGERTTTLLVMAIHQKFPSKNIRCIALLIDGVALATEPAEIIQVLDDYRVGWELIDHRRYSYWGIDILPQLKRGDSYS